MTAAKPAELRKLDAEAREPPYSMELLVAAREALVPLLDEIKRLQAENSTFIKSVGILATEKREQAAEIERLKMRIVELDPTPGPGELLGMDQKGD